MITAGPVSVKSDALAKAVRAKRFDGTKWRWERRGKSVHDVAPVIGVSANTLSRVERGKTVDLLSYAKLCVWLGHSLDCYIDKPKRVIVARG